MQTIHYKRGDMLVQSIGCMVLAAVGLWLGLSFHGRLMVLGWVLAACLPVLSIGLFVRALGDGVALRFDQQNLHVATLWSGTDLRWADVRKLQRQTIQQSSAFGLFKRDIAFYIVVTAVDDSGFERSFRVNERLIDWPRDAMDSLLNDLQRVWSGQLSHATGTAGRSAQMGTPAQRSDSAGSSADFDADAIMARYMERRKAVAPAALAEIPAMAGAPVQRTFGRKRT